MNVKAQFAELTTLVGDLLQLARGDTGAGRTTSTSHSARSIPGPAGPDRS